MAATKPSLVIIGAGGHAKVVADCAEQLGYEDICMLDDGYPEIRECGCWPVVGGSDAIGTFELDTVDCFVAIGNNAVRAKITEQLNDIGARLATLVHPTAVIGKHVVIGAGTLILANVVLNAFSSVGKACILNTACSVDHDANISDYVHIAPGSRLAGTVTVGANSFLGIGSTVIQQVSIGENVIIGAGSTVITDISNDVIAIGSPARPK